MTPAVVSRRRLLPVVVGGVLLAGCSSAGPGTLSVPPPSPAAADARRIAELSRDNERLRDKLEKAQLVIAAQKKVAALLDSMTDDKPGST